MRDDGFVRIEAEGRLGTNVQVGDADAGGIDPACAHFAQRLRAGKQGIVSGGDVVDKQDALPGYSGAC